MARPVDVTDETFEAEVLRASSVALVDFWAPWCGPCRVVAPVVEELAREYDGQVQFFKLEVDQNPQASMRYGVQSIPTLLLFRDGEPVDRIVGAVPRQVLRQRLDAVLGQVRS